MSRIVHQPLDRSKNEFRILVVQPSLDPERILVCGLESVALGDELSVHYPGCINSSTPIYEALSYTWGDDEASVQIFLEGQPWLIRPNLDDALRQLRKQNEPLLIFVDALCIDQNSTDEKNWQVKMMSRIYRQAVMVHCWLGRATENSERVIEVFRLATARDKAFTTESNGQPVCFADMKTVIDLFDRPYWNRAWIVQETTLATHATFHCGPNSISRDDFPSANQILSLYIDTITHRMEGVEEQDQTELLRTAFEPMKTSPINEFFDFDWMVLDLQTMGRLNAANFKAVAAKLSHCPHDHVYAFLGILEKSLSECIEPDYEQLVAFAYQQLAFHWFVVHGSGDMLSQAVGVCQNAYMLPSWVPDFSVYSLRDQTFLTDFYKCNLQIAPELELSNAGYLGIQAHAFDEVADALCVFPNTVQDREYTGNLQLTHGARANHTIWRPFFGLDPGQSHDEDEYPGGGSLESAYWRTLTAQFYEAPEFLLEKHIAVMKSWVQSGCERISDEQLEYVQKYNWKVKENKSRRFFRTRKGYFGRTDRDSPIARGDKVYLFASTAQPFLCRKREGEINTYTLLDATYVHGLMQVNQHSLMSDEERMEYGSQARGVHPQFKVADGKWEKIWLA